MLNVLWVIYILCSVLSICSAQNPSPSLDAPTVNLNPATPSEFVPPSPGNPTTPGIPGLPTQQPAPPTGVVPPRGNTTLSPSEQRDLPRSGDPWLLCISTLLKNEDFIAAQCNEAGSDPFCKVECFNQIGSCLKQLSISREDARKICELPRAWSLCATATCARGLDQAYGSLGAIGGVVGTTFCILALGIGSIIFIYVYRGMNRPQMLGGGHLGRDARPLIGPTADSGSSGEGPGGGTIIHNLFGAGNRDNPQYDEAVWNQPALLQRHPNGRMEVRVGHLALPEQERTMMRDMDGRSMVGSNRGSMVHGMRGSRPPSRPGSVRRGHPYPPPHGSRMQMGSRMQSLMRPPPPDASMTHQRSQPGSVMRRPDASVISRPHVNASGPPSVVHSQR